MGGAILAAMRDALFICAGDRETFASHAIGSLVGVFDLLIHYYGKDAAKAERLARGARYFGHGPATKFNALQAWHRTRPGLLAGYDTIWVCDDDLAVEHGDLATLPYGLHRYGLAAVAPAFSPHGKISHPITLAHAGEHRLRLVNFIEMTAPMFRRDALLAYLAIYDGSLDGWGNDWWFLNVLGAHARPCVGVDDRIVLVNPHDAHKIGAFREIDAATPTWVRQAQWQAAQARHGLREWPHYNLGSIMESPSR